MGFSPSCVQDVSSCLVMLGLSLCLSPSLSLTLTLILFHALSFSLLHPLYPFSSVLHSLSLSLSLCLSPTLLSPPLALSFIR